MARSGMMFPRNFALALALCATAFASDGSVSGDVREPDGTLAAEQSLVITNVATHTELKAKTDRIGRFGPISLPAGEYKLKIQAKCFKTTLYLFKIADGTAAYLNVPLERTCPKDL